MPHPKGAFGSLGKEKPSDRAYWAGVGGLHFERSPK